MESRGDLYPPSDAEKYSPLELYNGFNGGIARERVLNIGGLMRFCMEMIIDGVLVKGEEGRGVRGWGWGGCAGGSVCEVGG